jgi:hypothetical protein
VTAAIAHVCDDGGRSAAGYRGVAGDCACRAAAIATGLPYQEVYHGIDRLARSERPRGGRRSSAREGVKGPTFRRYMESIGWLWAPTMGIGTGCRVHLREDELPGGRLVLSLSRHYTAVIDGVLHDTYDCSREGTRCVYGYWQARS